MDTEQSTETVTRVPASVYDQMSAEGPDEPNAALRTAFARLHEVVVRRVN